MRAASVRWLLVAAFIAVALSWLLVSNQPDTVRLDSPHKPESEYQRVAATLDADIPEAPEEVRDPGQVLDDAAKTKSARSGYRTELCFEGRVLSHGARVEGAEVSLTPLHAWSNRSSWTAQDWVTIAETTVCQNADTEGAFSLCVEGDQADALREYGAALWATAPDAAPLLRIITAQDAGETLTLEMSAAEGALAVIEDAASKSGTRARVHLRGVRRAIDIAPGEEQFAHAQRVFHRSYELEVGQPRQIPGTEFVVAAFAEANGKRSEPQFAPIQGVLSFEIGEMFTVGGAVQSPCDSQVLDGAYVLIGRQPDVADRPSLWYGRSYVRDDGSFGIDSWPRSAERAHLFRLEGERIVAQTIELPTNAVGSELRLDFECEQARRILMRVKDVAGEPIRNALVRVLWQRKEGAPMVHGLDFATDAQGEGWLVCPERLPIWLSVWHPDHSEYWDGPLTVPYEPTPLVEVVLASPMTVSGRVLEHGKPASNFEIVYWQADPFAMQNRAFRDVADGLFELDGIPSAQTTIYATIQGRPQSATVVVDPKSNAPLVLEVGEGVPGRGRIMDGTTSAPIPGATAQVYSAFEYQLLTPIGPEVETDSEGGFLVSGLNPERAPVLARAPGYDFVVSWGGAVPGGIDFGTIVMWKGREVRLQLKSEESIDFSLCTLALRGSKSASAIPFDANGLARFEVASPGWLQFTVSTPHGHAEEFVRTLPALADSWDFELELGGSAQATLDLSTVGDCEPPADGELRLSMSTSSGMKTTRVLRWKGDRSQRLERLWSGPARVELRAAGRSLLVADLAIAAGENNAFELALPCERARLQLLHANREPVRAARVVMKPGGDAGFSWAHAVELVSSADGMLESPALPTDEVVLAIFGEATHVGVPLRLERAPKDGVQRVVLGAEGDLRLVALDGEQALEGVHLALMEAREDYQLAIATSGADGSATWSRLAAGAYTWEASGAGVWFARGEVQLGAGGTSTHELELRRTGNARLRVLDAAGAPVAGIALELRLQELGESTSGWLASGLLSEDASAPVTDAEGNARFDGIPRGSYQWTASDGNGPRASGSLSVTAGKTLEQNLILP